MKQFLLALTLISSISFGQTVITSVQDGDFFGAGTWDCGLCFPTDGDTVIINHNINMNTGIPYTMGSITINSSGSLSDGGVDKDIYINGGQFINHGTLDCDGFWLDSGFVQNTGTMILDSLWTQDTMYNSNQITVYDFFNDEEGYFDDNGTIVVSNNFLNSGLFYQNGTMTVANDASNCNTQNTDATLDINGVFCAAGDFSNCGTDTLRVTGVMYIAGNSSNLGQVDGNGVINTPTSAFTFNTGNIGTSIVFNNNTCNLGSAQNEQFTPIFIYPNPAEDVITVTAQNINYDIYDITGRLVQSGSSISGVVGVNELKAGNYLMIISNPNMSTVKQKFVKL